MSFYNGNPEVSASSAIFYGTSPDIDFLIGKQEKKLTFVWVVPLNPRNCRRILKGMETGSAVRHGGDGNSLFSY